jgi:hypothetical protein
MFACPVNLFHGTEDDVRGISKGCKDVSDVGDSHLGRPTDPQF